MSARARRAKHCDDEFFDNIDAFVLDIEFFSSIIYIWYEGSELRLPLVRKTCSAESRFDSVSLTSFADEIETARAVSRNHGTRG